jgi:hypothetical protein
VLVDVSMRTEIDGALFALFDGLPASRSLCQRRRKNASVWRSENASVVGVIDGIPAEDKGRPVKQRHTSKRIFERLREERGCLGGLTNVKDYVLSQGQRQRETFVPLRHATFELSTPVRSPSGGLQKEDVCQE